ncbi:MAG: DUF971 domain-containing protein [Xanthomonadales bacterium]|nr:DUF971 domain-containing protein [Xanthomonadales bacterium]MBP8177235.1 DUF971 domain-containing protein [Xanthomonadales bacterium]
MSGPRPTDLVLHRASRALEIAFDTGERFTLPAELLRVYSPSAEVQGHAPSQRVLQLGKERVGLVGIDAVGHYAVLLRFDDGHDTGIYTWTLLYELGKHQDAYWQRHLDERAAAGKPRAADPA